MRGTWIESSRIRENSGAPKWKAPNSHEFGYEEVTADLSRHDVQGPRLTHRSALLNAHQRTQVCRRWCPEARFERDTDANVALAEIEAKPEVQDPVEANTRNRD